MKDKKQKDTVVFLNIFPLGRVFAESLGFDLLEQAGYKLIYLDLTEMYYPDIYNNYGKGNENYVVKEKFFVECASKEEVLCWIKEYAKRAWFFPAPFYLNMPFNQMWIQRAFKKYGCDYILQDFFPVPLGPQLLKEAPRVFFIKRLFENLVKFKLKSIITKSMSWISFLLMARNIYYRKPTFCFVAGKSSYDQFRRFYPKSKIISVPSFDYFKYRCAVIAANNGKADVIPSYKYLLYYDQSIFDTPDGRLLSRHSSIKKNIFFREINKFFDRIEDVTGKKVVIAGSPKIKYKGDEFNGREIIYNLTSDLTYYADMVIMHTTTAYNYAVAMHKPILFLKLDGLNENSLKDIYATASYFNKKVMDINEDFDILDIPKLNKYSIVNEAIYEKHVCDYMSQETFDVPPAEIMVDTLKNCDYVYGNGVK